MQEVPPPREQHRQPEFITRPYGILVTFAASRMYHSRDAVLRRQSHRVIEWEEAITGENGATSSIP